MHSEERLGRECDHRLVYHPHVRSGTVSGSIGAPAFLANSSHRVSHSAFQNGCHGFSVTEEAASILFLFLPDALIAPTLQTPYNVEGRLGPLLGFLKGFTEHPSAAGSVLLPTCFYTRGKT